MPPRSERCTVDPRILTVACLLAFFSFILFLHRTRVQDRGYVSPILWRVWISEKQSRGENLRRSEGDENLSEQHTHTHTHTHTRTQTSRQCALGCLQQQRDCDITHKLSLLFFFFSFRWWSERGAARGRWQGTRLQAAAHACAAQQVVNVHGLFCNLAGDLATSTRAPCTIGRSAGAVHLASRLRS